MIRLAILLSIVICFPAWAVSLKAIQENKDGLRQLEGENTYRAYRHFVNGLAEEPFSPELRMNLGLTFEKNEEFEKAYREYREATKLTNQQPELQFQALFNSARMASQLGQIEPALIYYQRALEIIPDSKEVKTNIELLWKGGGGKGDGKSKDKNKDQKGKGQSDKDQEKKKDDPNQKIINRRKVPKPFKSKELTKNDVRKILEELKNQEQKIRAKEKETQKKETPRDGKDW